MSESVAQYIANNSVTSAALCVTGQVWVKGIHDINTTASTAFVQLFDAAAAADITLGTTVPTYVVRSAATSCSDPHNIPSHGLLFRLGVVVACTTTPLGSTTAEQHVRVMI